MNDERLNFDALDPTRDPSIEQRVSAIAADAMRARHVRGGRAVAPRADFVADLSTWMRPALAAAVLIALVSTAALLREATVGSSAATPRGASAAEILGIPPSLISLTRSSEPPSVTQLAAAAGVSDRGGINER